jgi:putative intracellular protease/amidase
MKPYQRPAILIYALLLVFFGEGQAQKKPAEPKNVAIFLYQGVELLDFAGPGEVFSAADFTTYTMSVDGKALTSQGFVKIQPEFSIETVPVPDIVVFPGGSAGPTSNDPKVMEWIKKLNSGGSFFMSVCTGAFILANAGLLDNKRVTTHWGSTQSLGKTLPTSTVLENTRFVDNGTIITTAGVSAGIDGALHLVSRIKGLEAAKKTARYMEYEKWNPQEGVVDKTNAYLQKLGTEGDNSTRSMDELAPFPGEFRNMASALSEQGQYLQAEKVLTEGIRLYPVSVLLYTGFSEVYSKLGKPVPTSSSTLVKMIREGKIAEALARVEKDKKDFPGWKVFDEDEFNDAGYYLLYGKNDITGAIRVFELNVQEFPESANAYDSLGEAYLKAGKKDLAIVNYKKSLMLDEHNENARKVLAEIAAN